MHTLVLLALRRGIGLPNSGLKSCVDRCWPTKLFYRPVTCSCDRFGQHCPVAKCGIATRSAAWDQMCLDNRKLFCQHHEARVFLDPAESYPRALLTKAVERAHAVNLCAGSGDILVGSQSQPRTSSHLSFLTRDIFDTPCGDCAVSMTKS